MIRNISVIQYRKAIWFSHTLLHVHGKILAYFVEINAVILRTARLQVVASARFQLNHIIDNLHHNRGYIICSLPIQHFLYFLPLSQGQGSLRPIFGVSRWYVI